MNKRRLIVSFLITISILIILLIPTIEFIDWGFIETITTLIHWPLFAYGFFGEIEVGVVSFLIIWYGVVIGIGTYLTYLIIQIITNR